MHAIIFFIFLDGFGAAPVVLEVSRLPSSAVPSDSEITGVIVQLPARNLTGLRQKYMLRMCLTFILHTRVPFNQDQ